MTAFTKIADELIKEMDAYNSIWRAYHYLWEAIGDEETHTILSDLNSLLIDALNNYQIKIQYLIHLADIMFRKNLGHNIKEYYGFLWNKS